ncbi:hypothetical protein NQZ68_015600 [Dissostichus eleginoides]|nr:hypothetical protein NQZ68_015600 [Dissostichus eleginoides]
MACGNKLVTPKLKEGQEFDGHMIHKGYNSDTEDQSSAIQEGPSTRSKSRATHLREDSSEEGHSDGLIIDETATSSLPLNSYLHTTSSPPHTTNSSFSFSFSSSVVPVTTSVTSSVTASSSTIAPTSDYSSYVTLMRDVSDLSSDDEDLNRAIQASLQTEQTQATQHASVQEILSELADKISGNSRCKSNINRSAVLDGAFRSFNRATYNPNATMNIKFSDDLGRNEEAVDLGGPRREFLRLLMEALMMSFMFEGSEYSQNLALDIPGSHTAKPVLKDIADTDIYNQVSESSKYEDLIAATQQMQDYLVNAGCLRPLKKVQEKEQLVHDILMFQVVHRVEAPFQRLDWQSALTAEIMEDLFTIHLSAQGSNKRRAEEMVVPYWRDYLIDVEDQEGPSKLEQILAFATGATVIPPIGFQPTPSIDFLHEEEYGDSAVSNLPLANTCINCLKLPLHSSYSVFKAKLDFAFANTHGFGRA